MRRQRRLLFGTSRNMTAMVEYVGVTGLNSRSGLCTRNATSTYPVPSSRRLVEGHRAPRPPTLSVLRTHETQRETHELRHRLGVHQTTVIAREASLALREAQRHQFAHANLD